jgi:hypothetical protein
MSTTEEKFAWHITQALHHVNTAINVSLGDHRVGLSQIEKEKLEEVQTYLEDLDLRKRA